MMVFDWMLRRSTFLLLCLGFFLLSTTTGDPSYKLGRQLLTVTVDTSTVPTGTTTGTTSKNGGTRVVGTSSQGTVGISSRQNKGTTASTIGGTSSVLSDGTMTMMVNSVKNTSPMTTMKATEKSSVMTAPTQTTSTVTTAGATRENTSQKLSTFSPSTVATTEQKRSTPLPNTTAETSGTTPPTMSPSQTDPIADTTTSITIEASQSTACETCNQTISTYPQNATNPRDAQVNQTSSTTDTTYSMLNSITTTPVNVTGQGSSSVLNPEQVKGLIMICTTIGVLTILSIVSYSLKVCWWDKRPPKVDKGRKVYEVPPTAPRKVPKRKKSLPRDPRRGGRRRDDLESAEPYQSFDYDKYDHAYIQPVDHHPSGRYVYAYGGSSKSSLGSMPEEPEDVYLEMHR
ncbi:PREDICTED: mucin-5AC-like [Branchiostoma belcheri]|uniref:Mucin-5AC-like n=1 Tax=Branchiostoma belcheri TaxID=7741 RepID=A0A6P4ZUK5_BRABE|nr:PREDICTED: mucin-5AC-like [Branchiostoma belcheri]